VVTNLQRMKGRRMSGDERKEAIVQASLPLFARQGFASTTTKALAEAAGVSEALLYKHFPSKASLYSEIQKFGCQETDPVLARLTRMEPSTSTLVHIIYYMVRNVAMGKPDERDGWETRQRLVLNSCLEDGGFLRHWFRNRFSCCFSRVDQCFAAAAAAGDLMQTPVRRENGFRFAHNVALALAAMRLPDRPAIEYQGSAESVLNQSVCFVLRGLGLKDHAINTHFHPKTLAEFYSSAKP